MALEHGVETASLLAAPWRLHRAASALGPPTATRYRFSNQAPLPKLNKQVGLSRIAG